MPTTTSGAGTVLHNADAVRKFQNGFANSPFLAMIQAIAFTVSNARGPRTDAGLVGDIPTPRPRTHPLAPESLEYYRLTINNLPYENPVEIDLLDIKDDDTGRINEALTAGQAAAVQQFIFSKLIEQLRNGGSLPAYDGLNFFATTRAFKNSGNINNAVTASEVPELNVANENRMAPEEAVDVIVGLADWLCSFNLGSGRPRHDDARSFVVVAPMRQRGPLLTAMKANNIDQGDTNVIVEGFKADGYSFDLVTTAELTDPTKLYVLRKDGTAAPLCYTKNEANNSIMPEFAYLGEGSEFTLRTGKVFSGVNWRGGFGVGDPTQAVVGTLS